MAEKRPLALIALCFSLGIFVGRALDFTPVLLAVSLGASILVALAPLILKRGYSTTLLSPLFFSIGMLFIGQYANGPEPAIASVVDSLTDKDPFHEIGTPIEGIVLEAREDRQKRLRILLDADSIHVNNAWSKTEGRVLLSAGGPSSGIMRNDRLRVVARLQRPQNFGNPGEFDFAQSLNDQGVFVTGRVKSPLLIEKINNGTGLLSRIDELRGALDASIDNGRYKSAGIMKALITGSQGGVPQSSQRVFTETGTAHILSISGLHIATVALFFYFIAINGLKLSERVLLALNAKKAALLATIAPVVFYGLIAGFTLPTERAVLMALVVVAAIMLNRTKDALGAACLVALVMLAISPHILWDISFQLTFSAVISMIFFTPIIYDPLAALLPEQKDLPLAKRALWRVCKEAMLLFSVSIAASLGTYPIVAYHFNTLAITGFFANMLVVPIVGFIAVPLLLLGSIVEATISAGAPLFALADLACLLMERTAGIFTTLPFSSVRVPTPTLLEMLLFYLSLASLLIAVKNGRRFAPVALIFPLLLVTLLAYKGASKDEAMEITFISAGQGDSALIEFPDKAVLIDGAGAFGQFDVGERVVAPFLWRKRIGKIDYMVLTHQQLDHMEGLDFIIKNFQVGEFWWNGEGELKKINEALLSRNVPIKAVGKGFIANVNYATIEVLHPATDNPVAIKNANEGSLVLMITYAGRKALFAGDIGAKTEEGLVLNYDLDADVLKVAHHGSRRSSSKEFVEEASPAIAVASVGRDNPFGFPHPEAVERLKSSGATFFRTDKDGAVIVRINKDGTMNAHTGLTQDNRRDILGLWF